MRRSVSRHEHRTDSRAHYPGSPGAVRGRHRYPDGTARQEIGVSGRPRLRVLPGRALTRSEQITGRERDRIGRQLRTRYEDGESIRDLVARTGRSYGWVRMLLLEAGVELRTRGGDRRAGGARTRPGP